METERIGTVAFFGILIPGAYLAASLLLYCACVLELHCKDGHGIIMAGLRESIAVSAVAFFLVSYLFGVAVRLFATMMTDAVVCLPRRVLCLFTGKSWKTERDAFPYRKMLTKRLEACGMSRIPAFMDRVNPLFGTEDSAFFNYCKWFIQANEPAMAREWQRAEALTRFLAGTAAILLLTGASNLLFCKLLADYGHEWMAVAYGGGGVLMWFVSGLILLRYGAQRRKEVILVWSTVYLIVNGGTPSKLGPPHQIIRRVFFSYGDGPVPIEEAE